MSNEPIKFEGLDRILSRLEEISDPEGIYQALGKSCALVERTAKEIAPKGDGTLRRSISSKVDEEKIQGVVFTPLEYAPYVEYGTGLFAENKDGRTWDLPWHYQDEKGEWHSSYGQDPYPFMRPALEVNRAQIIKIIKEGITKKL